MHLQPTVFSENDPTTLPCPLLHSSTNNVEQKVGNSSLIYDPSVTATNVPLEIDCSSHATPLNTYICSHSHVFPQDCSTSKNKDGAGFCVVHGAMERRCQCSPSRVSCTKHIVLCTRLGWIWEYVNWFGFCPKTNTSSVLPSMFLQWRVDSALLQNHCHILCERPMKQSMLEMQLRLGHIDSIAFLHSIMSKSVGYSWGHFIFDHASPCGWWERMYVHTLLPDAVKISNINSNRRETHTLFKRLSALLVYPALISTCMLNWSPSLGNSSGWSATIMWILNIYSYSQSIFIQEWVTKYPYLSYCSCSGWNKRPSSTYRSERYVCMNRPVTVWQP